MAVAGDISLHAQSIRTYRTIMAQSLNQSLILPIKVASATGLWLMFQNQMMIESPYYNSLSRTCPFSCFQWTTDANYFVGATATMPKYTAVPTTSTAFSIQLRIGNEVIPQQPMQSINDVLRELNRSIHATADMNASLPFKSTVRQAKVDQSNRMTASTNASEYTYMVDKDFCTAFSPLSHWMIRRLWIIPSIRMIMLTQMMIVLP